MSPLELEMAEAKGTPDMVKAKPRLFLDVRYLEQFTRQKTPAVQSCQATGSMVALYLLGDASGNGMGSGLWDGGVLDYEQGNWAVRLKDETSNWKEASNLVVRIRSLAEEGRLDKREVFLLTDNQVFEGTFFKGHSNSPKLNDIIFELRRIKM